MTAAPAARGGGRRRVAVVGGGLAGITAALRCADAGCEVTLHEAKSRLGGLTFSFPRRRPQRGGPIGAEHFWVDNGQHVVLRCCTSYLALLDRLGVRPLLAMQSRLDIPVRGDDGRTAHLRRSGLPSPVHLARSLLTFPWLGVAERLSFARTAAALRAVDPGSSAADQESFGGWLRAHGQADDAIRLVWDLVGVAALNARADDCSLALAATVFQQGLLGSADAGDIGWSTVPLQQLHGDAAADALASADARVVLRSKVRRIVPDGNGWLVVTDGSTEAVDDIVLAAPPATVERLAPPQALALASGWSEALGSSPIVNVHLLLDRPVLDRPFVAGLVCSPHPSASTHLWVFDRTTQAGLGGSGLQYLAVSLSAADQEVDVPSTLLQQRLLPQLGAVLPRLGQAALLDLFVTRERDATFRPAPGSARLRPSVSTRLPGLHLAGAWTATGWPATMEGAVRSGNAAADALLAHQARRGGRQVVA